ncbi:MAG: hypothetical protein DRQ55_02710 [Planctomycetota bacterium]|nr:MAG: hypothetical protein DRQ55_02710 [Planctomycetota bacterium]
MMHRIALLSTLITALIAAPAAHSAPALDNLFRLEASPSAVDFGEAFEGEVLHQKVTVTNTGDEPWPVHRIQTSCGCTVAKLFDDAGAEVPTKPTGSEPIIVLEPGASMHTEVEFRTAGKHGKVSQTMQIYHTDQGVPPVAIPVSVQVSRALAVNPRWVNLGNLKKSDSLTQEITVEAIEIGDWDITGFASQVEGQQLPSWLEFNVLDKEGAVRRVEISINGPLPVGALSPRIKIQIDHPRIKGVDFTMTGIVRANVSFDSGQANLQENLNFEQFAPEEQVTRTLHIVNSAPDEPYLLEDVEVQSKQSEFFTVSTKEIRPGIEYEVSLTADGSIGLPFFRGNLLLKAKHPDVASKLIPFHGWVRQPKPAGRGN